MASDSRITPLHETHVKLGAKMGPFGGYDMPIQYGGTGAIATEHVAVRTSAGIFDVSHMGRAYIAGKNALDMLQFVLTNDSSQLKAGHAQYSFLIKQGETGRPLTLDDVYLYMLAEEEYALVVNAANAEQDFNYLSSQAAKFGVKLLDVTEQTSLISVQGPQSRHTLEQLVGSIGIESANRFATSQFKGSEILLATTGYTGEFTRYEAFVRSEKAVETWEALVEAGATPIGLGARNTLRIEGGLLLFGHDITDVVSPIEAGMGFAVKPGKAPAMIEKDFYERQRQAQKDGSLGRYLVLLEMSQPRQVEPKQNDDGTHGPTSKIILGQEVGEITSSTVAPMVRYNGNSIVYGPDGFPATTRRGLALGYSKVGLPTGTEIGVQVRGSGEPIKAIVMPAFLDKKTPLVLNGNKHVKPVTHYYA